MIKAKIEKLVFGGQGLAHIDAKTFLLWNALPSEVMEVENWKKKAGIFDGIAKNIMGPSPRRIEPKENHFLSCSPWQIMDWEYENEQKIEIAKETFEKITKLKIVPPHISENKMVGGIPLEAWKNLKITANKSSYGYRNKMEFSFAETDGQITLALFGRGSHEKVPLTGCELAHPAINRTAREILAWINEAKIPLRSLKTLIVRSNQKGETLAGLFLKDRLPQIVANLSELSQKIQGFWIYYSTHQSPASVPTELLYHEGADFLEEEIFGKKLRYGLFSFFQVNVPVFAKALADMADFVKDTANILDLYSGVGAIGICLADKNQRLISVDNNEESINFAKRNTGLNGMKNCEAIIASTEKALDLIMPDQILILDPPRSGLHKKVIEKILEIQPKKIVYLSCNLSTQARDVSMLNTNYLILDTSLYNFFPRTPHIEGLVILEKKET